MRVYGGVLWHNVTVKFSDAILQRHLQMLWQNFTDFAVELTADFTAEFTTNLTTELMAEFAAELKSPPTPMVIFDKISNLI